MSCHDRIDHFYTFHRSKNVASRVTGTVIGCQILKVMSTAAAKRAKRQADIRNNPYSGTRTEAQVKGCDDRMKNLEAEEIKLTECLKGFSQIILLKNDLTVALQSKI